MNWHDSTKSVIFEEKFYICIIFCKGNTLSLHLSLQWETNCLLLLKIKNTLQNWEVPTSYDEKQPAKIFADIMEVSEQLACRERIF